MVSGMGCGGSEGAGLVGTPALASPLLALVLADLVYVVAVKF